MSDRARLRAGPPPVQARPVYVLRELYPAAFPRRRRLRRWVTPLLVAGALVLCALLGALLGDALARWLT